MLDDILKRIEQGTTTVADADALRRVISSLSTRLGKYLERFDASGSQRYFHRSIELHRAMRDLDWTGGMHDIPGQFSGSETP